MSTRGLGIFVVAALAIGGCAHGQALPVDDYLRQVAHGNTDYKSLVTAAESAKTTSEVGKLVFSPQLFSKLEYIYDPRNTYSQLIYGDKHIGEHLELGVQQQTPFGLQFQLGFDVDRSRLYGTDPTLITRPDLLNTYIVPGFQFSLWQNFLGKMDRADASVTEAKGLADSYGKSFQARAMLVEAEGRYWKLAVLRELIRVVKESAARAKDLLTQDEEKIKKHLADPTDALLAESAVKGKELELQSYADEERSAARAFNSARGVDSDEVPEELPLPDPDALEKLEPPARSGVRGDVLALEQGLIAATAGATLAREKVKPQFNLYGSIYAIGATIRIPLELDRVGRVSNGYAEQAAATELSLERKRFEQESDWKDLVHKLQEGQHRLQIALELEAVQKRKYELIRQKKAVGLTIEAQVFQYELDYLSAIQNRVQLEGTILGVLTQMKLYGGEG
jgi:outer membrane protein TolC